MSVTIDMNKGTPWAWTQTDHNRIKSENETPMTVCVEANPQLSGDVVEDKRNNTRDLVTV